MPSTSSSASLQNSLIFCKKPIFHSDNFTSVCLSHTLVLQFCKKRCLRSFVQPTARNLFATHTRPFKGPLSGTTWLSRYQKGKTNLDLTEARDSEWQWHQLGRM